MNTEQINEIIKKERSELAGKEFCDYLKKYHAYYEKYHDPKFCIGVLPSIEEIDEIKLSNTLEEHKS